MVSCHLMNTGKSLGIMEEKAEETFVRSLLQCKMNLSGEYGHNAFHIMYSLLYHS